MCKQLGIGVSYIDTRVLDRIRLDCIRLETDDDIKWDSQDTQFGIFTINSSDIGFKNPAYGRH